MILFASFVGAFMINFIGFIVAFNFQTDKLTDLAYGLSFVAMAEIAVRGHPSLATWILLIMIWLWAIRLSGFLLYRVIKAGGDRRFDEVRDNFWKFGVFWLGQAVSAWIIMLPTILLLSGRAKTPLDLISFVGSLVWLTGLTIESLADYQKIRFRSSPAKRGKWIDQGLWHRSRHPNYFGEILVWLGIYIYTLPFFKAGLALVLLISPLWISCLLIFVSGIPRLEKLADRRWHDDPDYRAYKKSVPLLIPSFGRNRAVK